MKRPGAPPGPSFSVSGVWSGTPTRAGTYSFTLQVTDHDGGEGDKRLRLMIPAKTRAQTTVLFRVSVDSAPHGIGASSCDQLRPFQRSENGRPPWFMFSPTIMQKVVLVQEGCPAS